MSDEILIKNNLSGRLSIRMYAQHYKKCIILFEY